MREPPQMWPPFWCRLTCHGHLPGCASEPPMILVEDSGRPQSAVGTMEIISHPCPSPQRPRLLRTELHPQPASVCPLPTPNKKQSRSRHF